MIRQIVNGIIYTARRWVIYLLDRVFVVWISRATGVEVSGKFVVAGWPMIDIRKGCRIYLGNNVLLNSRNKGYHVNMHSPVKIFVDSPGATVRVGKNTRIHGSCIHARRLIEIGDNCLIAANCQIIDSNGHDASFQDVGNRINTKGESRPVVIGDNVWIGMNSVILPGVVIGEGAIISANSVVVKNVPPMVVVGGNPAVIIKDYSCMGNGNV